MAFVGSAGFVVVIALPGGSFDLVVRHQVGIAIWFALGLGVALGFFPRARLSPWALVPGAALGLLAAWAATGLLWSDSAGRVEIEIARLAFFAGVLFLWLAVIDSHTWRAAGSGLLAGAALVCVLALASRLWPDAFPTDYVGQSFGFRLSYPLQYWNALGSWAALAGLMSIAWSAHARTAAVRMAALAVVPIAGAVIYLTFSRGAVLAAGLGVGCVVILGRNRWMSLVHTAGGAAAALGVIAVVRHYPGLAEGPGAEGRGATLLALAVACGACAFVALLTTRLGAERLRLNATLGRRAGVVALLCCGAVAGTALAAGAGDTIWQKFKEPGTGSASTGLESRFGSVSGTGRVDNWGAAIEMFRSEPLRGTGFGSYEFAWNKQARSKAAVQDAHSIYLETLAEGGVVGLIVLVIGLGALLWLALRTHFRERDSARIGASAGLVAAYVAFLVHASIDWLWESTAVAVLALSAAIIVVGGTGQLRLSRLNAPTRVAATLVCILALLVMLPSLASTLSIRDSQADARNGNLQAATADANDAVDARPWAAEPYVQRGLVRELGGQLRAAERDISEAERRETDNWEIALLLARIHAEEGEVTGAVRAAREARRLRPKALPFTSVSKPSP
jgi:hypothetical protein